MGPQAIATSIVTPAPIYFEAVYIVAANRKNVFQSPTQIGDGNGCVDRFKGRDVGIVLPVADRMLAQRPPTLRNLRIGVRERCTCVAKASNYKFTRCGKVEPGIASAQILYFLQGSFRTRHDLIDAACIRIDTRGACRCANPNPHNSPCCHRP